MLSSSVLLDSTQVKFLVSITDFLCFFFKEIKEYVLQLSRIISIILLIFSYQTPSVQCHRARHTTTCFINPEKICIT